MGCGGSKQLSGEARYTLTNKRLGEGMSCTVWVAKDKLTHDSVAIKHVAKEYKKQFESEKNIMSQLRHHSIVEFVEAFSTSKHYSLVTKLCQGGELFDRIASMQKFSEKDAARLTRAMLESLAYCHEKNIVHRDLKPENFVFETTKATSKMKLIDFGCAIQVADSEPVYDYAGSRYYIAPEILNEGAAKTGATWKKSDVWSVGVILFLLVTGYPPFDGATQEDCFRRIRRGRFRFPKDKHQKLSDSVKELICLLLTYDVKKRVSAKDALQHSWVRGDSASDEALSEAVLRGIGSFQEQCQLKKAIGRALADRMTDKDKQNLGQLFKKFDQNGDGRLGPDEIAAMMKHIGKSSEEAEAAMANMDADNDGFVSEKEFASAAVAANLGNTRSELEAKFKMIDTDGNGYVTGAEIEQFCGLDAGRVKGMIEEVDDNGDGKINLQEWIQAMSSK